MANGMSSRELATIGRIVLRHYINLAYALLEQVQTVVVYHDGRYTDRSRLILTVRRGNRRVRVPVYRFYSGDLDRWVYHLRIPISTNVTPVRFFNTVRMIPFFHFYHETIIYLQGGTVYLQQRWRETLFWSMWPIKFI